jgi:hypothetical protein
LNLPGLKRIVVSSGIKPTELARQILAFVNYVVESLNRLLSSPRAVSTFQDVTLVAATAKTVSHGLDLKLGQTPSGWLVTDISANTTVRRNSWDEKTITIQAAANCDIRLEVW